MLPPAVTMRIGAKIQAATEEPYRLSDFIAASSTGVGQEHPRHPVMNVHRRTGVACHPTCRINGILDRRGIVMIAVAGRAHGHCQSSTRSNWHSGRLHVN